MKEMGIRRGGGEWGEEGRGRAGLAPLCRHEPPAALVAARRDDDDIDTGRHRHTGTQEGLFIYACVCVCV